MEQDNRTFTQEELNAIIGERLAKEKAKTDAELMKKEQELANRELLLTAREQLTARNLPLELVEALNISNPDSLKSSMQIMETVIKKIKEERPPVTFTGVVPGVGTGRLPDIDSLEKEHRKAMGLK